MSSRENNEFLQKETLIWAVSGTQTSGLLGSRTPSPSANSGHPPFVAPLPTPTVPLPPPSTDHNEAGDTVLSRSAWNSPAPRPIWQSAPFFLLGSCCRLGRRGQTNWHWPTAAVGGRRRFPANALSDEQ
uniref:Uncharacterized protein n=1 Tax=Eutreptiella gymnastica TaxID=73025 RepID=A0A7S4D0J0_9EUGL